MAREVVRALAVVAGAALALQVLIRLLPLVW
jgi:hypothetical protein